MIDISDVAYLTHHSATLEEVHALARMLAELVALMETSGSMDLFLSARLRELAAQAAERTSVQRAGLLRLAGSA